MPAVLEGVWLLLWQASSLAAVAAVTCAFFALPFAGVWPSQREERPDLIFPAQADESGIASFSFYTTETGLYKFKMIQVGHPVRDYNSSLNIESTDSLWIPEKEAGARQVLSSRLR